MPPVQATAPEVGSAARGVEELPVPQESAICDAEQVPLAAPPLVPEQVQEVVLPAVGKDVTLAVPFPHWVYGEYEEEPLAYVIPFAVPHVPATGAGFTVKFVEDHPADGPAQSEL